MDDEVLFVCSSDGGTRRPFVVCFPSRRTYVRTYDKDRRKDRRRADWTGPGRTWNWLPAWRTDGLVLSGRREGVFAVRVARGLPRVSSIVRSFSPDGRTDGGPLSSSMHYSLLSFFRGATLRLPTPTPTWSAGGAQLVLYLCWSGRRPFERPPPWSAPGPIMGGGMPSTVGCCCCCCGAEGCWWCCPGPGCCCCCPWLGVVLPCPWPWPPPVPRAPWEETALLAKRRHSQEWMSK
mmetsp:Transcript_28204/g.90902  ORF Transcript_28204/g.90902 Transcript_28204/m.90902 type:complete len:235 (-) Transcript_28204:528-1232(-)